MSRDLLPFFLLGLLAGVFLMIAVGAIEFGRSWPQLPSGIERQLQSPRRAGGATSPAVAAGRSPGAIAARMSLRELAGQRIIGAFRGATAPPPSFVEAIRAGRMAGVVLFADNVPRPVASAYRTLADRLQAVARAAGRPPLLIATDQESAAVARIEGPPGLDAGAIGELPTRRVRRLGRRTGQLLRTAGVQLDLAPVADVPRSTESFIAERAYSTDWHTVARVAGAFVVGIQSRRVAATAKHYPGLGGAETSTDLGPVSLDRTAQAERRDLAPFERVIEAGARVVMMSSAVYTDENPHPAVLAPASVTGLRRLGFDGVVVSDALDAAGLDPYGDRVAVEAANAGVDLLLWANGDGLEGFRALLANARSDPRRAAAMRAAVVRVLRLKRWTSAG